MRVEAELVEPIFPLPLAYYKYSDDKHKELLDATRQAIKKVQPGFAEGKAGALTHFYQHQKEHLLYDNEDEIFQHFHDWLEECYADYVTNVQGWKMTDKTFITDCWVNVTKEGGNQVLHSHANAFVSGTYYLRMEDGSGQIMYINPCAMANRPYFGFDNCKATPYNEAQHFGNCQEQYLILWPSNLSHMTTPTEKNATRVSISMNFMPQEFLAGAYNFKVTKK
tara:strand:- start:9575 stop:10243 length:669 start_codon:yes stop_codon:yes gene_type:complete